MTDTAERSSAIELDHVVMSVGSAHVTCRAAPERSAGRGYYSHLCFKIAVDTQSETIEVGDGGFVDWMARLLNNGKERLMTSGLSLERLAMLISAQ